MVTGEKCKNCGHADHSHYQKCCHWRQHGAVLACDCTTFISPTAEAVAALPQDKQKVIACAYYLGLNPRMISSIETRKDGGGHNIGMRVIVDISTGRGVGEWIRNNLPTQKIRWVVEYLEHLSKSGREPGS